MGKTVYIFGAGFSKPAGFPLQGELYPLLVKRVFRASRHVLGDPFISFDVSIDLATFLASTGLATKRTGKLLYDIGLEDIFTLLDRVIQDRGTYCGYGWCGRDQLISNQLTDADDEFGIRRKPSLIDVRDSLVRSILGILHACSQEHALSRNPIYDHFALHLLWLRLSSGLTEDPVSIISLNWDSLLEDSLFEALYATGGIKAGRALADVDYCVYTNPLEGSPHTPSTKQKASGIYNIKLLKLHGSTTWLRCPNSNLVYTALGTRRDIYTTYVKRQPSPLVLKYHDGREIEAPPALEPYIITPTFTKVFDLPQIQTTWHNAYVELREADHIVIIGYSLPDADYHFRALLRRAVRSRTRVTVVLAATNKSSARRGGTLKRYEQIFNPARLSVEYGGVEGYIKRLVDRKAPYYRKWLSDIFAKSSATIAPTRSDPTF